MPARILSVLSLLALLAGCEAAPLHQNPYDPDSPAALQARASLVGRVQVEQRLGIADPSGVAVELVGTGLVQLTGSDGAWRIDAVAPGEYSLRATKDGYLPATLGGITVTLDDGEDVVEVAPISLSLARGSVEGTVTLERASGEAAGSDAGILVTISGLARSVETDLEGRYLFENVPVGRYAIEASKAAFKSRRSPEFEVAEGATARVPSIVLAADPGAFEGRVLLRGEEDSSGVQVRATGTTLGGAVHNVVPVLTDASGAFVLSPVPAGIYTLVLSREGFRTSTLAASVAPGTTTTLEPRELDWQTGAAVGLVELEGASDNAGAQVALTAEGDTAPVAVALTASSGAWRIDGLKVARYQITYSREPGWNPAAGTIEIEADRTVAAEPVSLAVNPGTVAGQVLLEGAGPVDLSGTLVGLRGQPASPTDSEGRFSIEVGTGPQTLVITRERYQTEELQVSVAPGTTLALDPVTLDRARGAIAGAFALEGLSSASGIVVSAVSSSGEIAGATVTGADGAFLLERIPDGSGYTVRADAGPNWSAVEVPIDVQADVRNALPGSPVSLAPQRTGAVAGVATLEGQSVHSGVVVELSGRDFRGVELQVPATTSGAGGDYLFEGLPAGSYQLELTRAGFAPAAGIPIVVVTRSQTSAQPVRLALSRGDLTGAFRLAGMADASGIVVSLQGTTTTAITNESGSFTLSGVPVGSYTLEAAKGADWQPASRPVTIAADAVAQLAGSPITLDPVATATLQGSVRLEAASDHSGVTATLSGLDFRGVAVAPRNAVSDASGAFSFSGLLAGDYLLSLSRSGYVARSGLSTRVSTAAQAALPAIDLELYRGTFSGTVSALEAADQAGTVVSVSGPDSASAVTDGTGAFRISGLREGVGYSASVSRPGYAPGSVSFAIDRAAQPATATVTLTPSIGGSLSGTALLSRFPAAGSHAGITVSLTGTDFNGRAVTSATSTAASGAWQFTGLKAGTYALGFSKAAYVPQTLAGLALPANGTVNAAQVTLEVASGTIAGRISLAAGGISGLSLGTDASGVTVTLEGTEVPVPSTVTDSTGSYRFTGVPVSLTSAAYSVVAEKAFFLRRTTSVTAAEATTVTAAELVMPVAAGELGGTVLLRDNVADAGDNANSAGTTVTVSGTAFNGTAWSATATTSANGTWTSPAVPPGTYQLEADAALRTCEPLPAAVVEPSSTLSSGVARCLDAVAPGALTLSAVPANVSGGTLSIALASASVDATAPLPNLRGYQLGYGDPTAWTTGIVSPPFSVLLSLGANRISVRAVDWVGNVGPASVATVYRNDAMDCATEISTSRDFVDGTSTTVTLALRCGEPGVDADPDFDHFEVCTTSTATFLGPCPECAAADWSEQPSSLSLSLSPNRRTCVWARAVDLAGNRGQASLRELASDLLSPAPPELSPDYDPAELPIRADYVDLFVTAPATDEPFGSAVPWSGIAFLEVDAGRGFVPICPQRECRNAVGWQPCSAECLAVCDTAQAQRRCDEGALTALRVRPVAGATVDFAARAVDFAGNVGDGDQVSVRSLGAVAVSTDVGPQTEPRIFGSVLAYVDGGAPRLTELGANRAVDASDPSCTLDGFGRPPWPNKGAALYSNRDTNALLALEFGADGRPCTADDATITVKALPALWWLGEYASAAGAVAWIQHSSSTNRELHVLDGGVDRKLGSSVEQANSLQMGLDALLVRTGSCPGACSWEWVVYSAPAGWGTAQAWTLPATARSAALSHDGERLFWIDEPDWTTVNMVVCERGADAAFGTADDACSARPHPQQASASIWSLSVDRSHATAIGYYYSYAASRITDWNAGGNGRFEPAGATADDGVKQLLPTTELRQFSALDDGLLVFSLGDWDTDLFSVDLSTLRWEVTGNQDMFSPISNGAGTAFYWRGRDIDTLHARSADGAETSTTFRPFGTEEVPMYAADGRELLLAESLFSGLSPVRVRDPGADGRWFTADDTTVQVGAHDGYLAGVAAGGGKGFVTVGERATERYSPRVFEYVRDLQGRVVSGSAVAVGSAVAPLVSALWGAVSAYHALWLGVDPGTGKWTLAYHDSLDGRFGDSGEPSGVLTNSAQPGLFAVSGNVVVWSNGLGITLLDAGADRRLRTADDVETTLELSGRTAIGGLALAGNYLAFTAQEPEGGGRNVYLHNRRTGTTRQLTSHYSSKGALTVDPMGRVVWEDGAFVFKSLFLQAP